MSQLDSVREEIAYLKLWLGIMVATGISLIAWFLNNFRSEQRLFLAGALMAILAFAYGCFALHKRIDSKIDKLRRM